MTHSAAAAAAASSSSSSSSWVLFVCAELSLAFFQAADHDSLVQELRLNYTSDSLPTRMRAVCLVTFPITGTTTVDMRLRSASIYTIVL